MFRSNRRSSLARAAPASRCAIDATSRRVYQTSTFRIEANRAIARRYSRTVASTADRRRLAVEAALAAGDRHARRQPLHVPFERAGQRLVEVVDAEHEPPVGRAEDAEVRRDARHRTAARAAPSGPHPRGRPPSDRRAPRKNANGEASIRPYRIGTSSGNRVLRLILEQLHRRPPQR